jgi:rhodanese-related sulfurtransferase
MKRISTSEAAGLLAQGGYDLVDVREPHEWRGGHLPGARHVPLAVLAHAPADHLPKDRVIFVCGHGMRSLTACAVAERAGLAEVYSVEGGTVAWAAEGRPLDPGAGR